MLSAGNSMLTVLCVALDPRDLPRVGAALAMRTGTGPSLRPHLWSDGGGNVDSEPGVLLVGPLADVAQLRSLHPRAVILLLARDIDATTIGRAVAAGVDDVIDASEALGPDSLAESLARSVEISLRRRALSAPLTAAAGSKPCIAAGRTARVIAARIPLIMASAIRCVHVSGESGTGKDVVARLFEQSVRPKAYLAVNCAAIAPALLESTLFGSVRGAFTGSVADQRGYVEAASGGWLFLDEVACLSESAQAALLRVIENQEIMRVGDSRRIEVDVRFVTATNASLRDEVAAGRFRHDLWQRLCEVELGLPTLRERRDEIAGLIEHLLGELDGGPYEMTAAARRVLCSLSWREGNVRQLRNCLRAMTELRSGKLLTPQSIPLALLTGDKAREAASPTRSPSQSRDDEPTSFSVTFACTRSGALDFDKLSGQLFVEAVKRLGGSHGRLTLREMEPLLRLSRSTISRKLHHAVANRIACRRELDQWVKLASKGRPRS